MTPDKETSMRSQLADYSKDEFIQLAINLQDVIDDHISQKARLNESIEAQASQVLALQQELENAGDPVDGDELEEVKAENAKLLKKMAKLQDKMEDLRERYDKVAALNEKYQEKLLDAV